MTLGARLELLEAIAPGISRAERIELKGSSARVSDGIKRHHPTHAWIRVSDPTKVALLKASVMIEMVNKGLSFQFEKKSTIDRARTVGIEARTVIDLSVWDAGRLVFTSKPELSAGMDDYQVDDAGIQIVNQGAGSWDLSWVKLPEKKTLAQYKEKT
jgi:hypothetical protein